MPGRILSVLVRVPISVKRHHDRDNSYKGKCLMALAHSFRDLVHFSPLFMVEHGSVKADVVLEKKLRVTHLDLQAIGRVHVHTG